MATAKITDDDFLCPICLDFFKEPVILECEHNFCKSCIDTAWDFEDIILCPVCRHELPVKKYTVNRLLSKIVETAEMTQQCEEAGKPRQEQKKECLLQSHECLEHKEPLKVFCQEDGSPICLVCTMSSKHAGHTFQPLEESVSMFQEKLKIAEAILKHRMNNLNEYQRKQERLISGIQKKAQSFEQHIKSEFATLHQFLQNKEQQLIQQLKDETTTITGEMKENLQKIEKKNETIQRQISAIQSKLQQEDPLLFLTGIKDEIERTMKEYEKEVRHRIYVGVVSKNLSPGVYKGPLQYSVWKEMLSVVNPGLSPLTLDPNTAYPNLVICKDLTSVKYSDIRQKSRNDHKDFFFYFCLGSEGFTSGKHYWELEVEVNEQSCFVWTVGVTKTSSQRKVLSKRNPEDGYWVLTLSNISNCIIMELTPNFLMYDEKRQKVGVYLDYEEGQVSFYNADNMSHLYTFTDTFTERLYPFFQYHPFGIKPDTAPLKLSHLKL
ncbi:zinc-binding protein A33-like [Protopterus annectens]|uniref:zinc-binding protein A33-like n=1 Tax=Protopterus annectens TaxID=7888 RepID=UPI001CFB71DA|nr:zinc-binding protein A33-like [Protopterus annectens]